MGKRTWWLGGAAAVSALLAAFGVGMAMADPNDLKPYITNVVQQATGRSLRLNGPIRLHRSLWPTLELNDVRLANLDGGSRPDMARAEQITAQLSLSALVFGQIKITHLTLVGPNILFEQVAAKPNWIFERPRSASSPPSLTPFELRVQKITIRNGMMTWRFPARTKVLGIRSLEMRHLPSSGLLNMEAVFVYADNQPFRVAMSAQPDGNRDGAWTTRWSFRAFDTTASASGTMDLNAHYDLQVEGTTGALERLNALLPDMQLPAVHGATLFAHIQNGATPGELPVIGAARLHVNNADLGDWIPGLQLGATDLILPGEDRSASITGTGQIGGRSFILGGAVAVPLQLDARNRIAVSLQLRAPTARDKPAADSFALQGTLTSNALRYAGLEANVSLRLAALAPFRSLLPDQLPALSDIRFDGRFMVPADGKGITLRDGWLRTRQGDVAGNGAVTFGAPGAVSGDLHAVALELDAVLLASGLNTSVSASASTPTVSAAPLPWAALHNGPDLDLTARIDALTFQQQTWRNLDLTLQLAGTQPRIGKLGLMSPDGSLQASVRADFRRDPPQIAIDAHAPALPLAVLLQSAALPGSATGTIQVDTHLRAEGRNMDELRASLDGSVSVSAAGGRISNAAFRKLSSNALLALGLYIPGEGDTTLDCLEAFGTFAGGVGRFDKLALATTYLSLAGVGQIDLGHQTVAFKFNPLVPLAGSSVAVPIVVEGPFDAITAKLNASGLDKLGLLIDAWFGGDQPPRCSTSGATSQR